MRQTLAVLVALGLLVLLCACGEAGDRTPTDVRPGPAAGLAADARPDDAGRDAAVSPDRAAPDARRDGADGLARPDVLLDVLLDGRADVPDDVRGDAPRDAVGDDAPRDVPHRPDVPTRRPHGDPCRASLECQGQLCLNEALHPDFVDGYCTGYCDEADPQSCGPGAACFDMDVFLPLCAKRCETDADCRPPTYVCAGSCVPAAFTATLPPPGVLTGDEAHIRDAVAAVDLERLLRRVRVLAGEEPFESAHGPVTIVSRCMYHPDRGRARDYLAAELAALGLAVEEWPLTVDVPLVNLLAEVPGADPDLPPVLVVAHYDSTGVDTPGWDPGRDPAPGASDNASGVAVALEVATILTAPGAPQLARTVRIVLFDGEEYGLHGSRDYAWELDRRGEPTACTLNVDMVGATTDALAGRFWFLFEGGSDAHAALGAEAMAAFVPDAHPVPTDMEGTGGSDSTPFWEVGRCAVAMIAWPRRLTNHTVLDLSGDFQPTVFHEAARAAVAVVMAWAGEAGGP